MLTLGGLIEAFTWTREKRPHFSNLLHRLVDRLRGLAYLDWLVDLLDFVLIGEVSLRWHLEGEHRDSDVDELALIASLTRPIDTFDFGLAAKGQ